MTTDKTFNKEQFAELLNQAKGDRTINRFAKDTNVSAAHISRLLRQLLKTAPAPETIAKLSFKAQNGVSYKDLMTSAGHILQSNTIDSFSQREHNENVILNENKMSQIILSHLNNNINSNFKIIKDTNQSYYRFGIIIEPEDSKYVRWIYDFYYQDENRIILSGHISIYGKISLYDFNSDEKYTIVVNSKSLYKIMLNNKPRSLKVNLYVALIDMETEEVIEESMLCHY